MLRDNFNKYIPPASDDLSVETNQEVNFIIDFIDSTIAGFRPYYLIIKDSDRENRISDFLIYYFNSCLRDEKNEGFPPFNFGKNPSQAESGKETDIGVVVLTKNERPATIVEFEAKRLSYTSNNKEYVCGDRGGIERFKRSQHGSHLSTCGMFGYVQSGTSLEWIQKINTWLTKLSVENSDNSIVWNDAREMLVKITEFEEVQKWTSTNSRINKKAVKLFHYFINLN